MCGIAGWLDFKNNIKNNERIYYSMSETLSKRGPDDNGMYISDNVVLIHRRLAVVDIENGKQPMYKTADGREYIIERRVVQHR